MVDDFFPSGSEQPSALVDCPSCGKPIAVTLRDVPPVAFPPTSTAMAPTRSPKHCPHCGTRLWIDLRARAPVALPAKPRGTALIPRSHVDTSKHAPTDIITNPPPLT